MQAGYVKTRQISPMIEDNQTILYSSNNKVHMISLLGLVMRKNSFINKRKVNAHTAFVLTLCLPVTSAVDLGKQFGPRIVGPDQGPNCLTF